MEINSKEVDTYSPKEKRDHYLFSQIQFASYCNDQWNEPKQLLQNLSSEELDFLSTFCRAGTFILYDLDIVPEDINQVLPSEYSHLIDDFAPIINFQTKWDGRSLSELGLKSEIGSCVRPFFTEILLPEPDKNDQLSGSKYRNQVRRTIHRICYTNKIEGGNMITGKRTSYGIARHYWVASPNSLKIFLEVFKEYIASDINAINTAYDSDQMTMNIFPHFPNKYGYVINSLLGKSHMYTGLNKRIYY